MQCTISDSEAHGLTTPALAVDLLVRKLDADETRTGRCLSMRAFFRVRSSVQTFRHCDRRAIRPETRVKGLLKESEVGDVLRVARGEDARNAREGCLVSALSSVVPRFGPSGTVADLSRNLVAFDAYLLKPEGVPWTRHQVREVVRAGVQIISGYRDFSDDSLFVRDLDIS